MWRHSYLKRSTDTIPARHTTPLAPRKESRYCTVGVQQAVHKGLQRVEAAGHARMTRAVAEAPGGLVGGEGVPNYPPRPANQGLGVPGRTIVVAQVQLRDGAQSQLRRYAVRCPAAPRQ